MPAPIDPVVRFWRAVEKSDTGCWHWKAGKRRGYGSLFVRRSAVLAHRFSWELHFGSIPAGMKVLHRCDNPECSRPDHLFLGTQADNNKDRAAKGRTKTQMVPGERHPNAKLTWAAVEDIRSGSGCRKYMLKYSVSKSLIMQVRRGEIWKGQPET